MKALKFNWKLWVVCVSLFATLAACASEEETNANESNQANDINNASNMDNANHVNSGDNIANDRDDADEADDFPEEITLRLHDMAGGGGAHDTLLIEPTQEDFPHITIEVIPQATPVDELLAAGEYPDMFFSNVTNYQSLIKQNELDSDLTEFVESYNYDLTRFSPTIIDAIRGYSDEEALGALPVTANRHFIVYNKDTFDTLGVEYVQDGITWDELNAKARELSREESGIAYRGMDVDWAPLLNLNQLSATILDPDTHEAGLMTDDWFTLFETFSSFYDIPGNELNEGFSERITSVMDGELAMTDITGVGSFWEENINFGIATLPEFEEAPGLVNQPFFTQYSISPTSEHREEAFQVIANALTDENMSNFVRDARQLALTSIDYAQYYGADLADHLADYRIESIFKNDFAPIPEQSQYEHMVRDIVHEQFGQVISEQKEISEALRDAQDLVNGRVEELHVQDN